ncbi:MAG TPA: hypothetical protein VK970_06525 [Candidatus Methylacidiphilales bacterium]|nr:hypothetical protein [Candidatus Methylacidiphilales bacterium]
MSDILQKNTGKQRPFRDIRRRLRQQSRPGALSPLLNIPKEQLHALFLCRNNQSDNGAAWVV